MFASPNAHLATTGPSVSSSTLEGAPAGERPGRTRDRGTAARALWLDPFRSQRARYGPGAGFRWWHRLGAAVALLALIGLLAVLLAALVGFVAFVGGIALESLIG